MSRALIVPRKSWILTLASWVPTLFQVMVLVVPFAQTVPAAGAVTVMAGTRMENLSLSSRIRLSKVWTRMK